MLELFKNNQIKNYLIKNLTTDKMSAIIKK